MDRFFVVIDVTEPSGLDKHELADWLAVALNRDGHVDAVVYETLDDLTADAVEQAGAFDGRSR